MSPPQTLAFNATIPLMGSIYPQARFKIHPKQEEQSIHLMLCNYLRLQYPDVIFRTDGAGLKLTKMQAIHFKRMQSHSGWPDLFIMYDNHGYKGLFLELKKDNTTLTYKRGERKGTMVKDLHLRNQAVMHERLKQQGYWACFAVGLDQCIDIVDRYIGRKNNLELF